MSRICRSGAIERTRPAGVAGGRHAYDPSAPYQRDSEEGNDLSPGGHDPWFDRFVAADDEDALPFERIPAKEVAERRIRRPYTNLGVGRSRFRLITQRLRPRIAEAASVADVGAYPGTTLRLVRAMPGGERSTLAAVGFAVDDDFAAAAAALGASLLEAEFDVRALAPGVPHLLDVSLVQADGDWDVVVCSEVIEHTLQPLALLLGCHRLLRYGGEILLTTNSASFVGDILKLASGRHNVEAIERSHVLVDHQWRPHMRLYLLPELRRLLELCGYVVEEGFYFDNGNTYVGSKGAAVGAIRRAAGCLPRLRSHMFVRAVKTTAPRPEAVERVAESFRQFGLPVPGSLAGAPSAARS